MIKPIHQLSRPKIYLIGYGVIIPFCLAYPRYMAHLFDIRNKVIRFAFSAVPVSTLFRCAEAMYGFHPVGVDSSFQIYFIYSLIPLEIEIDPKEPGKVKTTLAYVMRKSSQFFIAFLRVSALLSLLSPGDYSPFSAPSSFTFASAFHPGRLMNHFIGGILLEQVLSVFAAGLSIFFASLTGIQIVDLMNGAMFTSMSPSDFWGKKWNRFIHGMLKRGVYKPVRKYSSYIIASIAAFLASGLFHEWVLYSMYVIVDSEKDATGQCSTCYYPPSHGKQLAFFIWNAIVVVLQHSIGHIFLFRWIRENCSAPLVTALVLLTVLPIAHLFLDDYIRGRFFHDLQAAFLMVRPVHQ